jgi:basic membrane protein A and related proteins
MHLRTRVLPAVVGLTLLLSACGGSSATSAPSGAQSAAPSSQSAAPSSQSAAPSAAASSAAPAVVPCPEGSAPAASPAAADTKIGVVTDIGTLNDKNFNEYSFKGAQDGAKAIGAPEPQSIVPTAAADYGPSIQSFIDQKYNVLVTVGFNLAAATGVAACNNKGTTFIGVDQSPICLKADGSQDFTFPCPTDSKTIAPTYTSLAFQEDQAGYLAGIVAAGASKSGTIGAIGGTSICGPCVRYIQGYELGAKSVNPNINVVTAYVTNDFSPAAFQDQAGGKTFAENFLAQNAGLDILFQVAGLTGNGILDAACAANIKGIGVDVDQFLSYPNAGPCLLTSAEKHLQLAVSEAIKAHAAGTLQPGTVLYDAKNDGIGVSPGHDNASAWAADTQTKLDAALAAMKAGSLKTCPDKCGTAS